MDSKVNSIKCNLIIDGKSVSAILKHHDKNSIADTAKGVTHGCIKMLKSYCDSKDSEIALGFSQTQSIKQALDCKVGEYLQGRYEPEIKEIKLSFKDAKNTSQNIGFTLTKIYA